MIDGFQQEAEARGQKKLIMGAANADSQDWPLYGGNTPRPRLPSLLRVDCDSTAVCTHVLARMPTCSLTQSEFPL